MIAVVALVAATAPMLLSHSRPACLDPDAPAPHDGMVWIPSGDYVEGDTLYPEEGPFTPVHVKGFWMDRHEVTNGEFARFVAATGYVTEAERPADAKANPGIDPDLLQPGAMVFVMPERVHGMEDISQWWHFVPGANWRHPAGPGSSIEGKENFPVVEITHADALAYANWKGHALPTEAEWEWAARAGDPHPGDDHDQPKQANTWQGIFPVLNSGEDGFVGLAPVGCYGASKYRLFDMFGNVWEMTADLFRPRHGDPAGPDEMPRMGAGARYTIKGGSFLCAPNYCVRYRSGAREGQEADLAASHLGFRTVVRGKQPSP
ncbi:MAG: formylglycine-generating enzyme family protein [Proteobacteria bacterium]|nr:formylglycine-generating enzyme family protein [Pseudomonadota bacterium]